MSIWNKPLRTGFGVAALLLITTVLMSIFAIAVAATPGYVKAPHLIEQEGKFYYTLIEVPDDSGATLCLTSGGQMRCFFANDIVTDQYGYDLLVVQPETVAIEVPDKELTGQ